MASEQWDQRYREGETPWDNDAVCRHLVAAREEFDVRPRKSLEIGCGTGTNAIWLAREGFDVTAVDISREAIRRAKQKAEEAGVSCQFLVASALDMELSGGPFAFAYDRGCFHTNHTARDRSAFAATLARHLAAEGRWLSVIGSTDGPPRDTGPPRRSALEIVTAVEPHFEILELKATPFNPNKARSPASWRCLARKRRQW